MINLLSVDFVVGISLGTILGLLIGFIVKSFLSKNFAENTDSTIDYTQNLKDLKTAIEGYQTKNSEDRGAVKTLLTVQTGQTQVKEEAERIKNTFISGGGQKQGVWGEMVLNNILTNNLGFKEGREFLTQKLQYR